jgi:RNA polymerase sigma factor (TIGR02999 family)
MVIGVGASTTVGRYPYREGPSKFDLSSPLRVPARIRCHRVTPLGSRPRTRSVLPTTTVSMNDVTRILSALEQDGAQASEQLLPLVYDELRKLAAQRLAQEKPGQTLQATALVHEAYLRLVGCDAGREWHSRVHFLAAAAEAMRRILIDRARDRKRLKRVGSRRREDLDLESLLEDDAPADDLIDVDEAIGRLKTIDAQAAALVNLRLFAGLTMEQAASALGISRRTAERDWTFARTWLFGQLGQRDGPA